MQQERQNSQFPDKNQIFYFQTKNTLHKQDTRETVSISFFHLQYFALVYLRHVFSILVTLIHAKPKMSFAIQLNNFSSILESKNGNIYATE